MATRTFWQKPELRFDEEKGLHRPVTWLELFFDLFFVVVIAQIAHTLSGELSWTGFGNLVLLFLPVWWIWVGITYYNERFETEGFENRFFTFLLMIPVAGMAVFAHHGLGETYTGFVLSYGLGRLLIILLWARGTYHSQGFRPVGIRFIIGFCLAFILIVVSAFVESPLRFVLFGVALFVEMTDPLTTIRLHHGLPQFSTSKLPERFGLFLIIVLGESVVGVVSGVAAEHHLTMMTVAEAILGIAIGFSLWWIYFDFIARRPARKSPQWGFLWGYMHLPLVVAITALGASLQHVIGSGEEFNQETGFFVFTIAALALFAVGFLEIALHRKEDEPTHHVVSPGLKFVGAVLLFIVGLSGVVQSSFLLLIVLFAAMIVQMVYGLYVWFSQEVPEINLGES